MDHIYIRECEPTHTIAPLSVDAARHIAALRLRDGEQVKVLNGRGLIALCTVRRTDGAAQLDVTATTMTPKPPSLTLVMSVLDNRDRYEFALEKATELGITRFIPLLAERSQHHRVNHDRLVAKAIAALTQCGVAWLPEILPAVGIDGVAWNTRIIMGDDQGAPPNTGDLADDVCVVVGPEGDFSDREKSLLANDLRTKRWAIGRNRLRAETAAIALIANVVSVR
ncbi:MAG TPA: RsmE family RNA methyltransferase [Candidatus Didemnitutus sp.]|nr:RsmE family RNA methyltransferase [Candidatus Didemnitutus sp.]